MHACPEMVALCIRQCLRFTALQRSWIQCLCQSVVTNHTLIPHLIVILKDLVNAGDIHLVDCAIGLPTFRAFR